MLVFQDKAFVHVPKTGGSWATDVILKTQTCTSRGHGHDPPHLHDTTGLTTGCVLRHPLGWVLSFWRHWTGEPRFEAMHRKKPGVWVARTLSPVLLQCVIRGDAVQTLENFCAHPGWCEEVFSHYTSGSDVWIRYETLTTDLARFLNTSPEVISSFGKKNVSKNQDTITIPPDLYRRFMSAHQGYGYDSNSPLPPGVVV